MVDKKKLVIVSTRPAKGKGGISTALVGYLEGLEAMSVEYVFVESHWQNSNTFVTWMKAFWVLAKLAFKYRSNAVFWYHPGPWFSMVRKCSLAIIPRAFGVTTIAHIHSPAVYTYVTKNAWQRFFTLLCFLPFKELVALTPWWKRFFREQGFTKKIHILPNPSNVEYFEKAKFYLDNPRKIDDGIDNVNILTMARIAPGKNVDQVIRAFAHLPQKFLLTVAGDGPLLASYKELVSELNLEGRVTFTGWVSDNAKAELLVNADIFCLPSTYDSFGMVFIEAMAFDLPVIAYGWGPISDVVTPEVGISCKTQKRRILSRQY